jgi:hypothetical protein
MDTNKIYKKKYLKYKLKFLNLKLDEEKKNGDINKINLYKKSISNLEGGDFFNIFGSKKKEVKLDDSDEVILNKAEELWILIQKIFKNFGLLKGYNKFTNLKKEVEILGISIKYNEKLNKMYSYSSTDYNVKLTYAKVTTYNVYKKKINIIRQLSEFNNSRDILYNFLYYIIPDRFVFDKDENFIKKIKLEKVFKLLKKSSSYNNLIELLKKDQCIFLNEKISILKCKDEYEVEEEEDEEEE